MRLGQVVKPFPTPRGNCSTGASHAPNRQGSPDLQTVVQMFPTPAAQDAKNSTLPPSQIGRDTLPGRMLREGQKGQLNPDWVEWMMGFPRGWTDVGAQSEILPRNPQWWDIEPTIPRVAVGIPHRAGRLKCLGNAVVPAQFYPIFAAIAEAAEDGKNEKRN